MPSNLIRQEQATASFAQVNVLEAKEKPGDVPKEYRSHVLKLPMMIKQNGLIAAAAFVHKNRQKDAYGLLEAHLAGWLTRKDAPVPLPAGDPLYNRFLSLSSADYITATRDAQRLLLWLKRFSEALIGE